MGRQRPRALYCRHVVERAVVTRLRGGREPPRRRPGRRPRQRRPPRASWSTSEPIRPRRPGSASSPAGSAPPAGRRPRRCASRGRRDGAALRRRIVRRRRAVHRAVQPPRRPPAGPRRTGAGPCGPPAGAVLWFDVAQTRSPEPASRQASSAACSRISRSSPNAGAGPRLVADRRACPRDLFPARVRRVDPAVHEPRRAGAPGYEFRSRIP
jgi:hypothetical protein